MFARYFREVKGFQCLPGAEEEGGPELSLEGTLLGTARELAAERRPEVPRWLLATCRRASASVALTAMLFAAVASAAALYAGGAVPVRSRVSAGIVEAQRSVSADDVPLGAAKPAAAAPPLLHRAGGGGPGPPRAPPLLLAPARQASSEGAAGESKPAPWSAGDPCKGEEGIDYQTSKALYEMAYISSTELCQQKCREDSRCGAWTWGKGRNVVGLSDVCFLKGLAMGESPTKSANPNVVSGLPCGSSDASTSWASTTSPSTTQAPSTTTWAEPTTTTWRTTTSEDMPTQVINFLPTPATMYCWALMLPNSYEEGLLSWQYRYGTGIFACDKADVYTNRSVFVTEGLTTRVANVNLQCEKGGEFGTALNTDIFREIWQQVVADGRYAPYGWTVKADPDTVFIARRLVPLLRTYGETERGVYLNNCKRGLHGPLEVFSRRAVETWVNGSAHCYLYFYNLCSGPCLWGEDMFIDQCLGRALKVDRVNEYHLLTEDHCDPPEGWDSCDDTSSIAFHPFKTLQDYQRCLGRAEPNLFPGLSGQY